YGNHGIVNGVTPTLDRFGVSNHAFNYDGVTNYIAIPHASIFNFTTAFTFSFWMKPSSATQTFDAGLIAKGTGTTEVYCVDFTGASGVDLRFFSWMGGSAYITNSAGWLDASKVGKWYHVVARYNGATQAGELFINGQPLCSSTFPSVLDTNTEEIAIGGQRTVVYDKFFNGCMDDVRFYNRALSATEINALYHEGGYYPDLTPVLIAPPDSAVVNTRQPTFTWHAPDSAASYRFQLSHYSDFQFPTYDTVITDTTFTPPANLPDFYGWWHVKAYSAGMTDSSAWSEARYFEVDIQGPFRRTTYPQALAVRVRPTDSVMIYFSERLAPAGIRYRCNPDPGGWTHQLVNGDTAIVFRHAPFAMGGTYNFYMDSCYD
ncbi:LamG domain-containing protein, partial [bacterium]|nr:LamG domain-containing protein [bacterium]